MAEYMCKFYGNCANADDRRHFTLNDSSQAVCPVCGESKYLKKISTGNEPGKKPVVLLAVAAILVLALGGGVWWTLSDAPESSNPPEPPENSLSASAQLSNSAPLPYAASASTTPSSEPAPTNPPGSTNVPEEQQTTPAESPVAHPELFGVIEIGAKGIKGFIADLDSSKYSPDCQSEETFPNCVIKNKLDTRNVNAIEPGAVEDAANAAKAMLDAMISEGVDVRQIYVVGSSSVGAVSHRDRLKETIENRLNMPGKMGFIEANQEGAYAFQGVLHLIPDQWREKRKKQAVLLDVGSGNTKGAYMEGSDDLMFIGYEIPWGTKTFSNQVDNQRGDGSFKDLSARLRHSLLRPAIREVVQRKQGLLNRERVYLIGGISWALSNLTSPGNKQHFPGISPAQIELLYNRTIQPNAMRRLCGENPDRRINKDIDDICQTFTIDNLIAGMDLLKTLSEEMHFKDKTGIFFMRESLYAWPLGYLKERCKHENQC